MIHIKFGRLSVLGRIWQLFIHIDVFWGSLRFVASRGPQARNISV
jgi:hypothetical protein